MTDPPVLCFPWVIPWVSSWYLSAVRAYSPTKDCSAQSVADFTGKAQRMGTLVQYAMRNGIEVAFEIDRA
jgi:hypothetical protein